MPTEPISGLPGFTQGATSKAPTDDKAMAEYPLLMQCLLPIWKDGKCVRQSGGLRIRLVGGYFLASLHCPTEGVEATLTTDTLSDLLLQLENSLKLDQLRWFPDFERQKKTRNVRID